MGKLIFNAQAEPLAPVGASKHTMYVDCCDGVLKMKDSDGYVNNIICKDNIDKSYFGYGTDCCVFTEDCIIDAKTYQVDKFIVCQGVTLRFRGGGTPVIITNDFCNMGTLNMHNPTIGGKTFVIDGLPALKNIAAKKNIDICVTCTGGGVGFVCNHGGSYSASGLGEGGQPGCPGGDGPNAGGGGGGSTTYACCGMPGNQETGIGGDAGSGECQCYCGGGGWGLCGGGNGATGGNGGNSIYGKGGDGGGGFYCGRVGGGRGGNSVWGNGGNGGGAACNYGGGAGGNSVYGNGGNGGDGHNCYLNGGMGGHSMYGNGGNGGNRGGGGGIGYNGGNGGDACRYTEKAGKGGDSNGGMYGLGIIAKNYYNNCIFSKGGNGGNGGCNPYSGTCCSGSNPSGGDGGNGSDGGIVYIYTNNIINEGCVNVGKGCGGCGGYGINTMGVKGKDGIDGEYCISTIPYKTGFDIISGLGEVQQPFNTTTTSNNSSISFTATDNGLLGICINTGGHYSDGAYTGFLLCVPNCCDIARLSSCPASQGLFVFPVQKGVTYVQFSGCQSGYNYSGSAQQKRFMPFK